MNRLRRHLGCLAAAWLLCQVVTVTPALSALWVSPGAESELACTCAHGSEMTCPLHHKTAAGSKLCRVRSVDDTGTLTWSSPFGPIGLLPARTRTTVLTPAGTARTLAVSASADRFLPPDPPPPRA